MAVGTVVPGVMLYRARKWRASRYAFPFSVGLMACGSDELLGEARHELLEDVHHRLERRDGDELVDPVEREAAG